MTLAALVVAFFALTSSASSSLVGSKIFNVLSVISLLYALIAGFIFTSDAISAERREATFGLLYLTPLTSWNVIAGKLTSTSVQGLFGLVAVVPIFALTVIGGGVTGKEIVRVTLVILATLFLSLAAGIFASASARSRRGALGLTGILVLAPFAGAWIGFLVSALLGYISEDEKRKGTNFRWFSAYATTVILLITLAWKSGEGLIGSPAWAFGAASDSSTTGTVFTAFLAGIVAIAIFYLISASLCTEWYRTKREVNVENEESDRHVDDLFFPGLRSRGRIGNDPAHWLLTFLQSPPFLFYISLALMIVISIGHGAAPGMVGFNIVFVLVGILPYIAFNYTIARFCTAPFYLLERSGLLETILTTPLSTSDLARAQRSIFWNTVRLPVLFLIIASVPGSFYMLSQRMTGADVAGTSAIFYSINWLAGWLVFVLHLETLSTYAMVQGVEGKNPLQAGLRSIAAILLPELVLNISAPFLWPATLSNWSAQFVYFGSQLAAHALLTTYLLLLLGKMKRRLKLSSAWLKP